MPLDEVLALHQAGRLEEAEQGYRAILAQTPELPAALNLLGALRLQRGHPFEAVSLLDRAVALHRHPEHLNNLAAALLASGQLDRAEQAAREATGLAPEYADAHQNHALALARQHRTEEALHASTRAVLLRPRHAEAHLQRGLLLAAGADAAGSLAELQAALLLEPESAATHSALAQWYRRRGDLDASLDHARHAHRLRPSPQTFVTTLESERMVCDWSRAVDLRVLAAIAAEQPEPVSTFAFLSLPFTPAELQAVARAEARALAREARADAVPRPSQSIPLRGDRLRLGYLTGDVRNHPTAHLTRTLFAAHDRRRFEVFLYSTGPDDGTRYRRDIASSVEHFVDLEGQPAAAQARRVSADGVDVLVDLQGYTALRTLDVLARRPAPVQCHYLAYPATLGADFVDYYLADEVVLPPALARHFDEAVVWLPGSYQVNDGEQPIAEEPFSRARCGLPETGVVYCCFNAGQKIDPEVWQVWMGVMRAVEGSVLWLQASSLGLVMNLRAAAEAAGVSAQRLVFASKLSKDRHLARLCCADVVLDTFVYGAHTTASDALWAGVPVITTPGDTFASRVAASLLTAQGLSGLIAGDRAGYQELAIALGRDPRRLETWKALTRAARTEGSLFDTGRTARALEFAYARMVERQRAGLAPEAFRVPPQRFMGAHAGA